MTFMKIIIGGWNESGGLKNFQRLTIGEMIAWCSRVQAQPSQVSPISELPHDNLVC